MWRGEEQMLKDPGTTLHPALWLGQHLSFHQRGCV